jgi:hypothetical protein
MGSELVKPPTRKEMENQQQHLGDDNDALDSLVGSEIFVESELGSAATLPSAQAAAEARQIAPKEARLASLARILVYFILVVTSSLVSAGIYRDVRQAQQDAFDRAFENLANQLSLRWTSHVSTQLGALESLGIAITSYYSMTAAASSSNRTTPFVWSQVTIADFERRSAIFRRTAGAESVVLLPLVASMEARTSWESYVLDPTHQDWIAQGIEYDMKLQKEVEQIVGGSTRRQRHRRKVEESSALSGIWPTIYTMDGQSSAPIVDQGPPPFLPGWQSSPPRESWINFNFASHDVIGSSVEEAVRSKKAVLSKMMGLSSTNQSIGELLLLGTNEGVEDTSATGPTLSLLYPLYDRFGADRQIVGLLSAQSMVETLWKASLPFHSDTVEAVLENTCGQVVTYRIKGETIEYRGDGMQRDTNDENDSSLEVSLDLVPGVDYLGEPLLYHIQGNSVEDGADNNINIGGCDYVLRIHATQDMRDEYESNSPWLYAISVEVMLVLLLITFSLYDCLIRRYLKVILDAAIKARTIVGQIYPQIVQDRLFGSNKPVLMAATTASSQQVTNPQQEQHRHNPRRPPSDVSFASSRDGLNRSSAVVSMASSGYDGNSTSSDLKGGDETISAKDNLYVNNDMKFNGSSRSLRAELLPMHQLKSFLQEGAPKKTLNTSEHSTDLFEYKKNSKPIADLFPSVTVLFADISGFTAWSSSREPAQVFMLLETIYRSFDRIARKLVVFKVSPCSLSLWRSDCCTSFINRA